MSSATAKAVGSADRASVAETMTAEAARAADLLRARRKGMPKARRYMEFPHRQSSPGDPNGHQVHTS
ncbi:hypothetical protein Saso_47450 [Streptomyces asoensis]|uniref:Uncharacterized protein n=1 Tax=Streptomyces asoensis TaxID=249586 RepID=A0ABQ3S4N3_9ACTN|nr:hypothetical protein Saso_47450 [Streptomyces asoensis]